MLRPIGYEKFEHQAAACLEALPGLHLLHEDGVPILSGEIELFDSQGNSLDHYSIAIKATPDFPDTFPLVFETGGRIPKNYDWHVYETDGHCCIKTLPEEMLACRKGISLLSFIQDEVSPYFFSQTFRRLNGYFLQERSHSRLGWLEYFREVFHTHDDSLVISALRFISLGRKSSRTADCFCGSGRKFRKCHRDSYEQLSILTSEDFKYIFYAMGLG